jgi:hypothetical protein
MKGKATGERERKKERRPERTKNVSIPHETLGEGG